MTDETRDPDETPETDAVRRLLADARHDEPMPADVAARLDAVLTDLGRGEDPPARTPAVTSLPVHRRRRAAALLAAAAAIVVGGVVVSQVARLGGSPGGVASESAGGNTAGFDRNQASPGATQPQTQSATRPQVRHGRLVVRPRHFAADALAGRKLFGLYSAKGNAPPADLRSAPCPAPTAAGRTLPARYGTESATLVYRRPSGGRQVVELYVCGSSHPLRSVALPAP